MKRIFTLTLLLASTFAFGQSSITSMPSATTQTAVNSQTKFIVDRTQSFNSAILVSDDTYLTARNVPADEFTETLILTGFNFESIPNAALITGIQINIEGNSSNNRIQTSSVQLTNNSTPTPTTLGTQSSDFTTDKFRHMNDETVIIGGQDELFGLSGNLTGSNFKTFNFGVNLQFKNVRENDNLRSTLEIDAISITVYYELSEAPPVSLPVEFTGFTANKSTNGVSLTWNVATEVNVKSYEVEKSTNGSSYSKIGTVSATNSKSYSFTDVQTSATKVYYRIKNVDTDGKSKYSTVISYANGQTQLQFKAFPSTTKGMVTLQHPAVSGRNLINLTSIEGKPLQSIMPARGAISTTFDLSAYPSGTYLIRFQGEGTQSETFKIFKL